MDTLSPLVTAAQAGDLDAFGQVVERFQRMAYAVAFTTLGDAHLAEDVAQEAFVRAYRALDHFDTARPLRPWLLRIVTNQALNYVKASERHARLAERYAKVTAMHEPNASPEQELSAREQDQRLLQAVDRLDQDERTLLALRYFLELSEREIADTLQIPLGTCKSRLHRTLARLREIIRADFTDLAELS